MSQYPELKNRVAVITGAGRQAGLGEAMAKRLAAEGCKVIITDIGSAQGDHLPESAIGSTNEMQTIVDEIKALGGEATSFVCNVLSADDVKAAAQFAVDTYGRLDIWVNNAGIGYLMKPILEMAVDEWDSVLNVNLRGTFLGIKFAAEKMVELGVAGKIINIGSQASKSAFSHASAYTTSKHGMNGLTRVAAQELGQHNINVNQICPNHVTTGLGAWQNSHFSEVTGKGKEKYMQEMRERIPLGRPGSQEDTANACAFLCSDQASYITGECMNVSGGEEYH
ncbi:meso-butanediol dehydrogenase / (S,S)-butanediol dehydrogenase / diacetyl reductase [Colwellia chukchiensis]|uniref:Meso-butanediol dehydrogenase / (S,S)-butanediol dehydrogenase / diacetyl reductase n=1 Tax=Colwellia chukchiensis TaxID=641665 RepID=A0A1H7K7D3_9GAMM|nr:SDR family NAD(P)-dependent oxidoreductase [Colwellia chukchiensis]SEK81815.1 meso-butanediol dehydrogenase / (S,S)-butanediol dehydrogenase / diacetyl reductase [Colwellia chukchiensis]